MMPTLEDFYSARQFMVDALRSELIGGPADEVISEEPLNRFVTGILYPVETSSCDQMGVSESNHGSALDCERLAPDSDHVPEESEDVDVPVSLSHVRKPSACGLSFSVPEAASKLFVDVAATRYLPIEDMLWRRSPVQRVLELEIPSVPGSLKRSVADGLNVQLVTRPAAGGVRPLTLALTNEFEAPIRGRRDEYAWYQVALKVRCVDGFLDRPTQLSSGLEDEDVRSGRLLFRNVRNLAVGHGCATTWDDGEKVTELSIDFLPTHEVRRAETAVSGVELRMSQMASSTDYAGMLYLVHAYRLWIDERQVQASSLGPDQQAQANEHLDRAREAADRMEAGITLLERDATARHAFQLMNEVMRAQRDKQEFIRNGSVPEEQYWRPFQMAFILMNLPGLTDPQSPEREFVDLLWFPTGGGKTEAYLGLIAYAILLRRFRDPRDGGVSVIMRYTLRLLTLQQFERAAGLICALEVVRRREMPEAVGISLGLWVGRGATPNSLKEARTALSQMKKGVEIQSENPMQLSRCPWCGTPLSPYDYQVDRASMRILCSNQQCEFSQGIPAHVVDEEVYRVRPSLVIGTVDKFAMMAWKEDAQSLFSTDGANSRPDLIIQDELHLISGPLGTMVGLYETAVDAACSQAGTRPKVVASTATIRRASKQVACVFARGTRQFPPPGLDSYDSFFSVDAERDKVGTREYVGVMAQGSTHTYLMVRVYAALLQAAAELPAESGVQDAFWTLMGYFNSLRVLGGAAIQVTDDVPAQMQVISHRHGTEPRPIQEPSELTSRIPSSEVPKRLDQLSVSCESPDALDVVLATNMISVGLDVDRLGLMVVMGQPQATAEYIQATSRVGRRNPGLVVVIYNASRSRDLSHYEGFAGFHRTLYRQVEPNSVTPFSPRARDRGLHGAFVAAVRSLVPELRSENSVARAGAEPGLLDPVVHVFEERVAAVAPDESHATADQLGSLVDSWGESAGQGLQMYSGWFRSTGALLVQVDPAQAGEASPVFPVGHAPWPTLTSLRDVDAQSSLFVVSERRP